MLAGRMKLKHFLLIVGGLAVAGITAGVMLYEPAPERPTPKPVARPAPKPDAVPLPGPGSQPAAGPEPAAVSGPSATPVERAVMRYAGKDLGSDKLKDVTKGQPFKVNVYQDAGQSTMNRAKVDLDRDDKWDEKWTFDGSSITRQIAPNDDENYTETMVWTGEAWAKEGS